MKINVWRAVDEVTKTADRGVEGVYQVVFNIDIAVYWTPALYFMALDIFHSEIPIACLDDFEITVLNEKCELINFSDVREPEEIAVDEPGGCIGAKRPVAICLDGSGITLGTAEIEARWHVAGHRQHPRFSRRMWDIQRAASGIPLAYWPWVKRQLTQAYCATGRLLS